MDEAPEPDSQQLLPPELRKRWVVMPRYQLAQFLLAAMALGAAVALTIVGLVRGISWMYWSLAGALAVFSVLNRLFRGKDRRYEKEAREYASKSRSGPPA